MRSHRRLVAKLTAVAAMFAAWPACADTIINVGNTLTLSSAASVSSGPITFAGNGTMSFTGSFTLPNDIVFNGGITGSINSNAQSDMLSGILSGAGSLSKIGTGTLALTGNNTFSGGTTLTAGTLAVGSDTALGTGAFNFSGGTLLGTADVAVNNTLNMSGSVTVGATAGTTLGISTVFGGGNWNFASGTTLTIGSPTATGTVLWGLQGGANAAGLTSLNIAGGTLKIGVNGSVLPSIYVSPLSIGAGGTLDLAGNNISSPAALSGTGRITSSSGTPTLTTRGGSFAGVIDSGLGLNVSIGNFSVTGSASYTGATAIASGQTLTFNSSTDSILSGIISGAGALTKQGTGTLTLTGNNTFSGGTTLTAGTLAVGSDTALGTGAFNFSGGTLLGTADVAVNNTLNMSGSVTVGATAGTTLGISTVFGGGNWNFASGTTLTIGSPTATGTVLWGLQGGANAAGLTSLNIAGGTLKIGVNGSVLPSIYVSPLSIGAGGTLDLAGNNISSPAALSGTGRITSSSGTPTLTTRGGSFAGVIDSGLGLNVSIGNFSVTGSASYTGATAIASGQTLTFNSSTDSILSGIISGAGALTKQGTGTLTLTGNNTFSGGTTNAAGSTLQLGNGVVGGTLGNVANGGTLLLQGGTLSLGTVSQVQAGSSVKLRSGSLNLTGSGIAADTFIVGDIAGGTAAFGLTSGKSLATGAETVGNSGGGTFTQAGGTHVANSLLLGANLGSSGIFTLNGGSFTVGSIALGAGTGTFNFNGGSFIFAGDLHLTNFNIGVGASYSGNVNVTNALVNMGTLSTSGQIAADGSLDNNGTLTLFGGTLGGAGALSNYNQMTGFGTIGGSGGFTNYGQFQPGGGGLLLSKTGANFNYGNWDVNAGMPLALSGATLTNFGVMNLNNGAISGNGTLNNGGGGILAGRGSISVNFSNAGELSLTGGALAITKASINSGVINLGGVNASLTGGAITNAGIVQGAGSVSAALANSGTVEAIGGTLLLGGATSNGSGGLMTAGAGTRLVVSQGLTSNAGTIYLAGGAFDNNSHALSNTGQISGFGTFRASSFSNTGDLHFTGGTTLVNGSLTNQAGGTLQVSYNPATFTGNVVNQGFIKTTATTVTWTGSFTNNGTYLSDPSTQVFQDITLGTHGALQGGVGDVFVVTRNMVNNSQANTLFDLSAAKLSFSAGSHNLVWSAANLGATAAGYQNNFAVGSFELASGGSLILSGTGSPGINALYVHGLLLGGGLSQIASIQSGGLNIYYDPGETANAFLHGATYGLAGGGNLMAVAAVPEPESYALWLAGIALTGGIAYRRRASRRAPVA